MDPKSTSDEKKNRFFHSSVNVTEWMRKKIEDAVEKKGYVLVMMDINTETMSRMSKLGILNNISLKIKDKDNEIYSLDGYSSSSRVRDEHKKLRWLVDEIKEFEGTAMLKYGGATMQTQSNTKDYSPKDISVKNAEQAKYETLSFAIGLCSTVNEVTVFLTEENFIKIWSFGRAAFAEGGYEFEAVKTRDISRAIENAQAKDAAATIAMEYKWKDWAEYSKVSMRLEQIGSTVKVSLVHSGIPVGLRDQLRVWWNERVFRSISEIFRCAIKTEI
ncbi:hypothetical protein ENBRE01_2216 [Enteropsectra breve]|nr:hypothetical protein ENBRE01_2216 [Enteropsectra breve]